MILFFILLVFLMLWLATQPSNYTYPIVGVPRPGRKPTTTKGSKR